MPQPTLTIDPNDGALRDAKMRKILLRGVNVGGRCKWAPFAPGTIDGEDWTQLAQHMTSQISDWGLNTIRLSLNWEALEPQQGHIQFQYLEQLRQFMDAAHRHHQWVILDFHQDIFAAPFAGNGFPQWTLPRDYQSTTRPSSRLWFLHYALDQRVQHCFDRFWSNTDSIQTHFIGMWQMVLETLADHPALIGIDIINEPGWGQLHTYTTFKYDILLPFYERVSATLHPIAPHLLHGYGMPGIECTDIISHQHERPRGQNLMATPHLYDPTILLTHHGGMSIPPEPALAAMGQFQRESATPVLIGEFGITHGARDGLKWLQRVYDGMDRHHIHGTVWEYSRSNELWNGEDLNIVGPDHQPRPVARVLARPYPRAISAKTYSYTYDEGASSATLSYKATSDAFSLIAIPNHLNVERISPTCQWRINGPQGTLQIANQVGQQHDLTIEFRSKQSQRAHHG